MALLAAAAAFAATIAGGTFALKLGEKRHLILGFSAGAVFGVAFFDLLPSAFEIGGSSGASMLLSTVAIGFISYLLLDRLLLHRSKARPLARGWTGAITLSLHSFLEGLGIGLGFEASPSIGIAIALAIVAHDFSDGINVVNVVAKHGGSSAQARGWLAADALGPIAGVGAASLIPLSQSALGFLLCLIGGFFLYISAADLIPESFRAHPRLSTTVLTLLGSAVMFAVVSIAG